MEAGYYSPDRAQYRLGEPVSLVAKGRAVSWEVRSVELSVLHERRPVCWTAENGRVCLGELPRGNYGVRIETGRGAFETAFDVTDDPRGAVRYGFLADFSAADGDLRDVEWLCRLHLNTAQFYDWMYRHDRLLPPSEEYEDPIGRPCSLPVIRSKIEACRTRGIRPFAYGAVYAATGETFRAHPDWAAYRLDGNPLLFADWLYYMNIAAQSPWCEHLIRQYLDAIALGFSGIHMDTYGFPKRVYDSRGRQVCLEDAFAPLIDRAARAVQSVNAENGVIFNAVNDWPTESIAAARADAVYIEVWSPHDAYRDLYLLIQKARLLSDKPIVLAAYLEPFADTRTAESHAAAQRAFFLANAVIMAAGGTQLVFGGNRGLLSGSYYADYAAADETFCERAAAYADFLVRYAALLYDFDGADVTMTAAGGINEDIVAASADGARFCADGEGGTVWLLAKETRTRLTIHLINLTGNDQLWNAPKNEPPLLRDIRLSLRLDAKVRGLYCASPDGDSLAAQTLHGRPRETDGGLVYDVVVPSLKYLTTVWVEME